MDLTRLIQHPELLDRETLYELRSLIALYPYYQSARLLMLRNLYVLHDPTFDDELRKAAVYITDRKVIFNLVEAAHYKLRNEHTNKAEKATGPQPTRQEDRTALLIDNFLESLPVEEEEKEAKKTKRKPTAADAAIDYVSYLLETENMAEEQPQKAAPQMKGQALIDSFINNQSGKIKLQEQPEYFPENDSQTGKATSGNEEYYTETLARIYIRQRKYERALYIIQQLNLNNPKKSGYFADQIRFLEKLILNEKAGKLGRND